MHTGEWLRVKHTTVGDGNRLGALATLGTNTLNGLDNVHARRDLAEHTVLSVQMGSRHSGDEKLAAVRVGARIGHGQKTGLIVLQGEGLILELATVDGLAASAVTGGEIATLCIISVSERCKDG
jgi:hypothetical protein